MHDSMLEGALLLGENGYCVFPLKDRSKQPRINNWQNEATTDPAKITQWWRQWPNANVGVATGSRFGLIVLDVDVKDGGLESYEEMKASHPDWFAMTLIARTGGGGLHIYFRSASWRLRNSVKKLAPGLDVRGEGGLVVAPPSLHASGNRYEWIR